jgi:protein-tyrosine phosphatase
VIDVHTHILYAVDDGPDAIAGSIDMARSMAEDGVRVVCATPHVREDWPTTSELMETRLERVRSAVAENGIELEIRGGGEIALDRLPSLEPDERRRFGLGGNPLVLLLEFPYYGWPLELAPVCTGLLEEGITTVIAHPERNADVQGRPHRLEPVVHDGALVQLTAASVDGRLGKRAATCSRTLLELRLAHLVASDAHAPEVRRAGMSSAAQAVGDEALGRWLCQEVPAALLAGEDPPPRPRAHQRQRRGILRRYRR